jgi:hypothetical protein
MNENLIKLIELSLTYDNMKDENFKSFNYFIGDVNEFIFDFYNVDGSYSKKNIKNIYKIRLEQGFIVSTSIPLIEPYTKLQGDQFKELEKKAVFYKLENEYIQYKMDIFYYKTILTEIQDLCQIHKNLNGITELEYNKIPDAFNEFKIILSIENNIDFKMTELKNIINSNMTELKNNIDNINLIVKKENTIIKNNKKNESILSAPELGRMLNFFRINNIFTSYSNSAAESAMQVLTNCGQTVRREINANGISLKSKENIINALKLVIEDIDKIKILD